MPKAADSRCAWVVSIDYSEERGAAVAGRSVWVRCVHTCGGGRRDSSEGGVRGGGRRNPSFFQIFKGSPRPGQWRRARPTFEVAGWLKRFGQIQAQYNCESTCICFPRAHRARIASALPAPSLGSLVRNRDGRGAFILTCRTCLCLRASSRHRPSWSATAVISSPPSSPPRRLPHSPPAPGPQR